MSARVPVQPVGRTRTGPRRLVLVSAAVSALTLGAAWVAAPPGAATPGARASATAVLTAALQATANGTTAPAATTSTAAASPAGASVRQQVVLDGVAHELTVPAGFDLGVRARVPGARFLAVAPDGAVLVSQPGAGSVARLAPGAGPAPLLTGLAKPHDLVFASSGGTTYLYVSEEDRVERWAYDAGVVSGRQLIVGGLPSASNTTELHGAYAHALKNLAISGSTLYVSVASATNADPALDVDVPFRRGAVYTYSATATGQAGSAGHLYARGLRNAEGLAVLPGTSTLWAAVNNRDNTACPGDRPVTSCPVGTVQQAYVDQHPPEELTSVRDGGNYGWPFCNPDPDGGLVSMPFQRDSQNNPTGARLDCDPAHGQVTRIDQGIQAHSAPLGLTFTQGSTLPAAYRGGALVALHGSWNRTVGTGAKIAYFAFDPTTGRPGAQVDLVSGWQDGPSHYWGRPVDTAVAPGGTLLITDDGTGTVFSLTPQPTTPALAAKAQQDVALLGAPLDAEHAVPGGRAADFADGSVLWSAATGAHTVHGAIGAHYAALGGPGGLLGLPVTDELALPGGTGRAGHFTSGSVYWSPRTGAFEVHGAIRATYASLGWEGSRLGYPVSDEHDVPGGRRSDFSGGSITWDAATGRTTVRYA